MTARGDGVEDELRLSRDSLTLALRAGRMGTWSWDQGSDRVVWDEMMCELYAVDEGPSTFAAWLEMLHPDERERMRETVTNGLGGGLGFEVVRRVELDDGSVRFFDSRADVARDATCAAIGLHGVTLDATERETARREAERLAARARLIADAGEILASTLEPNQVLRCLTEVVVPALADACEVAMVEPSGGVRRFVRAVGVDDDRIVRRENEAIDDAHPIGRVLRTGRPARIGSFAVDVDLDGVDDLDESGLGPAAVDTSAASFGVEQAVIVPMRVRGQVAGALALGVVAPRGFDADIIEVATEIGARAALSFDNARLFSQQQLIASTLQRSLVPPELPTVEGLDLAARYWVPGLGIDVGGDFYDVIDEAGSAVLIIGDVCGKGVEAASLTALARHTLRTAQNHLHEPLAAIRWLHDEVSAHAPDLFVTVAMVRMTPNDGQVRCESVVGGHPRPLVVRLDGTTDVIDAAGPPPGVPFWQPGEVGRFLLGPGDTLLLYTDGVTDVPGDAALTTDQLREIVAQFAGYTADRFATELGAALERIRARRVRTDDIALLVARAPQ